jgi:hypothetical protein
MICFHEIFHLEMLVNVWTLLWLVELMYSWGHSLRQVMKDRELPHLSVALVTDVLWEK